MAAQIQGENLAGLTKGLADSYLSASLIQSIVWSYSHAKCKHFSSYRTNLEASHILKSYDYAYTRNITLPLCLLSFFASVTSSHLIVLVNNISTG